MTAPLIPLTDGVEIPQLGLGVWQIPAADCAGAVQAAIDAGYRHIDTAKAYDNEAACGDGIRASGLPREQIFVTTKVWNADQGHDEAIAAAKASLRRLGLDHVDLLLIHWPMPTVDRYVETWQALVELQRAGLTRAIGVSNFEPEHLRRIIDATGVTPAVNQVELHPYLQQRELRDVHAELGIVTESWSPLAQGKVFEDATLAEIAERHERTIGQVVIRWHLQHGFVLFPKSATHARIAENFDVFGFALTDEDMAVIDGLDAGGRVGPDPRTFALQ